MSARKHSHDLFRLLERSANPVYAVDDEGCLVLANQATCSWVGLPRSELLGQCCKFHSGQDLYDRTQAIHRLCPPPAVSEGKVATARIAMIASTGLEECREVHFQPLTTDFREVAAVLAIAGSPLSASETTSDERVTAAALHELIQHLRNRFRQPFHLDRLLVASAAMARVRAQVAMAAATSASVLIVGPPGSGREHIARAIHAGDAQRNTEPLVPLACSLIDRELLRSTVAALLRSDSSRPRATLLLNNVDCLPPADQADLPSLLSASSGKLRFLATARAPLVALAQRGEFLTLAAHQLSTLLIELPSLAERLSDLPLLAQLFLERANAGSAKQVGSFSEEVLDLLAAFPWSRDLDELDQIVRQSHESCQGVEITAADLPAAIRQARHASTYPTKPDGQIDLEAFLGRIELELIQRALGQAKGNKSKAAQLLGLNRPRLYRRLVQLGLVDEVEFEEGPE